MVQEINVVCILGGGAHNEEHMTLGNGNMAASLHECKECSEHTLHRETILYDPEGCFKAIYLLQVTVIEWPS